VNDAPGTRTDLGAERAEAGDPDRRDRQEGGAGSGVRGDQEAKAPGRRLAFAAGQQPAPQVAPEPGAGDGPPGPEPSVDLFELSGSCVIRGHWKIADLGFRERASR